MMLRRFITNSIIRGRVFDRKKGLNFEPGSVFQLLTHEVCGGFRNFNVCRGDYRAGLF